MSAFKNDRGSWTAKFYYTDWTGKRRQKKKEGFATKKEAQAFELDFLNNCSRSVDISFKNLVEAYVKDCKARLKPTTLETKEAIINNRILPYFGEKRVCDISVHDVRQWQTELISSEDGFSETYLKTIHNQLSAIFNYACKYYKLSENPARLCGAMGKKKRETMTFWTLDEFKTFLPAVSNKPASAVIFPLLFYSGMREGELLALTLGDFDFINQTVSITKTFAQLGGEDIIQPPKTPKSRRSIVMPPEVMQLVKDYAATIYDYQPEQRLFQFTKSYLHYEIKRGCKASGVKQIRVHDIRHSHASLLIELGFSPLLISERLGHENIETTLSVYSHLYPNKQSEVAEKLSNLIKS